MGLIGKVLSGAALIGAGALIGSTMAKDKEYSIQRDGDLVLLRDKVAKQEYALTRVQAETYMGNAAHNFKGAFVLGAEEIAKGTVTPQDLQKDFLKMYSGGEQK